MKKDELAMTEKEKIIINALRAIATMMEIDTDIDKYSAGDCFTFTLFVQRNKKGQYKFAVPSLTHGVAVEGGNIEKLLSAKKYNFIDIKNEP